MKKFAELPLRFQEVVLRDQIYLDVHIGRVALVDWCLCLELLRQHFVECVVFHSGFEKCTIEIAGQTSFQKKEGKYSILLTQADCDYASAFFLRYYRDGIAEVDHIDLQTAYGGYITLSVDECIPPVSVEEAKKRLGLK